MPSDPMLNYAAACLPASLRPSPRSPPPFPIYGPPQPPSLHELRLAGGLLSLNRADYLAHRIATRDLATAPLCPHHPHP